MAYSENENISRAIELAQEEMRTFEKVYRLNFMSEERWIGITACLLAMSAYLETGALPSDENIHANDPTCLRITADFIAEVAPALVSSSQIVELMSPLILQVNNQLVLSE